MGSCWCLDERTGLLRTVGHLYQFHGFCTSRSDLPNLQPYFPVSRCRGGKEVARHVGSSRGDLIGQILTQQEAVGLSPPPPPAVTAKRRSRAGLRRK